MRSIDILGKVLEYESWGVSWKADPRHRKMIIDHFGFNDKTQAVTVTGLKEEPSRGGEILLNPVEAPQFRAIAARFNYLAADCPKLQFATKEVCREMSAPTVRSHEKMKRLARYLMNVREVKLYYRWPDDITDLCVCVCRF